MNGKKILIILLAIVLVIAVFCIAGNALYDMNRNPVTGQITYEPIDVLPEGKTAVSLTEADFENHPALSIIFVKESPALMVLKESDKNQENRILESEGYEIIDNYPYVEYEGQLYECVWEFS